MLRRPGQRGTTGSQKRTRDDDDGKQDKTPVPEGNPLAPVPKKRRQATTKVRY